MKQFAYSDILIKSLCYCFLEFTIFSLHTFLVYNEYHGSLTLNCKEICLVLKQEKNNEKKIYFYVTQMECMHIEHLQFNKKNNSNPFTLAKKLTTLNISIGSKIQIQWIPKDPKKGK